MTTVTSRLNKLFADPPRQLCSLYQNTHHRYNRTSCKIIAYEISKTATQNRVLEYVKKYIKKKERKKREKKVERKQTTTRNRVLQQS